MKILPFKAVFPNFELITSPESFFGSVKYSYNEFLDNGFFDQSRQNALYIYRIATEERDFLGVVGVVDLEKFNTKTIKKHENTLAAKEQKQLQLILRRQAMVKPILLTHKPSNILYDKLYEISNASQPDFEINFDEEHCLHQFWAIEDEKEIDALSNILTQQVSHSYIADGHHRSAAQEILRLREEGSNQYDNILCTLFASDQLDIYEYNRLITMPYNMNHAVLIAKLSKYCLIKVLNRGKRPIGKFSLTMFMDNQWYGLKWKKSTLKKFALKKVILDVDVLNSIILKNIFKIHNIRDNAHVKYIEGNVSLDAVEEKTLKNENQVAFCLYPVDVNDIMIKADLSEVMPPKSTWFEPRMKNGLIIHDFK